VITDAIIRRGVRAAGYNRSPDPQLIGRLKQAGVLCIPTCGAPRHVEKAVQLGADAVIVQGAEGGGHTGTIPTSLLVPACAELVDAPIIAAGGFKDGRGLVAALAWGAAGIAMGTRFLLTAESPVPPLTTDRYLAAELDDVVVTTEIDGLPQRVIVNELLRRLESAGPLTKLWLAFRNAVELRAATGASPLALLRTALALRRNERLTRAQLVMAANAPILAKRAMRDGDPVHGYLPSGTVTGVIDDRPTCAALVARIMNEAEQTLKRLQLGA
jgi:NAD(P)H-dependent flavin oxidoreductase YrpB (nitropropane dioxygenase family)